MERALNLMATNRALRCLCVFMSVGQALGKLKNAGKNGCGITGVQYVVREGEDVLTGALVSTTCGGSSCAGEEEYATGVTWVKSYYFLQTGLPRGLHLVASCENAQRQAVRVGNNAADAAWYGVAVEGS